MLHDVTIGAFRARLRGELIQRGEERYDEARKVYNGMIDKYPLLIARCADVADVIAAVRFAREHDLLTAIRGGGHNGPGLGCCDDGLVIDLSLMKGVRVDPDNRRVRVGAGCTQGDMDHATHAFGLAVPSGIISTTGVSGLALGGGHGYLARKYGLTIDNLTEADVVLADGSAVTANKTHYSDLFWAIRGGGGNFGVVTSFLFNAHPVSTVFAGPLFWDMKDARAVMRWYRDFLPNAPPELSPFLHLGTTPSADPFPREFWGVKNCALVTCYSGPLEKAEEAIAPLRRELPRPVLDWMGPMPFPVLQSLFDTLLPRGMQWYWKGDFFGELTDKMIGLHLKHAAQSPSPLSLTHLYPIDGAVHQVPPDETAWNCRNARYSMIIHGVDPDPAKANAIKNWATRYWEALHPHSLGSAYVNFMMDEGDDRIRATYGENYQRLVAIKRKYDPTNFFRVNQNIKPE